jgi:hypothetical protein
MTERLATPDSAIDGAYGLPLSSAILFPASLASKKDVVVSSWKLVRTPLWPDPEGQAIIFENFPGCAGAGIGPPLICRSWVSEEFAIRTVANPWNWLYAMPVESDGSSLSVLSEVDKGIVIAGRRFPGREPRWRANC